MACYVLAQKLIHGVDGNSDLACDQQCLVLLRAFLVVACRFSEQLVITFERLSPDLTQLNPHQLSLQAFTRSSYQFNENFLIQA